MIVAVHIFSALTTLIMSGWAFFKPQFRLIGAALGLFGVTIATGTYLVLTKPTHILSVCLSGLLYGGFVGISLYAAKKRLAHQKSNVI